MMNFSDANLRETTQSAVLRSVEEKDGIRCDSDFSRIEELIKGNTFTREEITRLLEILNSRVDKEDEQKSRSNAEGDAQMVPWIPEILKTPSEGEKQRNERAIIGYSEKSKAQVGVSASPIDIALAYMAGRTTEEGQDLHNFISNGERAQPINESVRNPRLLPSPSPRPSICWPGAEVHDRRGYTTPQSQKGRNRLPDFPRTPYSRSILSKSKTKLQADTGYANTSTPFQQSLKSPYVQVKSRGETVDAYGSVGPIRRIRNKIGSGVRSHGSIFLSSPKEIPPKTSTTQDFGGFLPNAEKNVTSGETSLVSKYWSEDSVSRPSDRGISNTNASSSSQAAKKVLELLDRNKPTPKEKEAELKLATAWRSSLDANDVDNRTSANLEEPASQKNTDISGLNFPLEFDKGRSKSSIFGKFPGKGTTEARDAAAGIAEASNSTPGADATPIFGLKGTLATQNWNKNTPATTNQRRTETSSQFSLPPLSNGQKSKITAEEEAALKNQGTKHSLPLISTKRAEFGATSSDNGAGFTFPVSSSAGVLSEPPTPSIAPSSSATVTPSYSFGSKKSSEPSIVFSFPSKSSASSHEESDLKFSFGSEEKSRLCFSSIGKDSICY